MNSALEDRMQVDGSSVAEAGRLRDIVLLLLVCAAFYWAGNDRVPLFDRDEPRYAEATREMLAGGDWIVPYFNGNYRFDKPILIYWLMAAAYTVFGEGEFAARFSSGAFAAGTVAATYLIGTWMFGRRAGFWSAIALATAPLFCIEAKTATPDAMLVFFTTGSFACLWRIVANTKAKGQGSGHLRWALGFWGFLSLSFLAKGPVGAAQIFFALGILSLLRGWGIGRRLHWRWGIGIFLAVNLPWYAAVSWQTDGAFLRVALGRHVVERMATPLEGHRGFPGIYVLSMLATFSPWVTLVVPALRTLGRRAEDGKPRAGWFKALRQWIRGAVATDARFAFLAAWVAGPLVLLEPLGTKLVHYYLPAYPAWALLVGWFIASLTAVSRHVEDGVCADETGRLTPAARRGGGASRRFGYEMLAIYGLLGPLGAIVAMVVLPGGLAVAAAVSMSVGGMLNIAAFAALRRDRPRRAAVLLGCVGVWMAACTGWWLLPGAGPHRLAHRVAQRIEHHASGGGVVLFGFDEPSTVFYLGGHVPIPRSADQLADMLGRKGPVVTALTKHTLAALRASPGLQVEILESLRGYNTGKGRRQDVHIARVGTNQSVAARPAQPKR